MVTSQLIVLSFLVVAASSSFLNFSTLRTTNNNDIQSNAAFSGGYNRYDDFGGGGWGGRDGRRFADVDHTEQLIPRKAKNAFIRCIIEVLVRGNSSVGRAQPCQG